MRNPGAHFCQRQNGTKVGKKTYATQVNMAGVFGRKLKLSFDSQYELCN